MHEAGIKQLFLFKDRCSVLLCVSIGKLKKKSKQHQTPLTLNSTVWAKKKKKSLSLPKANPDPFSFCDKMSCWIFNYYTVARVFWVVLGMIPRNVLWLFHHLPGKTSIEKQQV